MPLERAASVLATPSNTRKEDGECSGKRTRKKKGRMEASDGSNVAPANEGGKSGKTGCDQFAVPLAFEAEYCKKEGERDGTEMETEFSSSGFGGQQGQQPCSRAATEASSAFSSFLTSAVGQRNFVFEHAMEKMFDLTLTLQSELATCSIPASVAEVLMGVKGANRFMNSMLSQHASKLNSEEIVTEVLQSIGFSLSLLACKTEKKSGEESGAELESQREELMAKVVKLFQKCLWQWSSRHTEASHGERSSKRARDPDQDAGLSDKLCRAAEASLQALTKATKDPSNDRHCVAIIKLALAALACDQIPKVASVRNPSNSLFFLCCAYCRRQIGVKYRHPRGGEMMCANELILGTASRGGSNF